MRKDPPHWLRRIAIFAAFSLLLHLLGLWLLKPPPPQEQARLFLATHSTFFDPFRPYKAQRPFSPQRALQRIESSPLLSILPPDLTLEKPAVTPSFAPIPSADPADSILAPCKGEFAIQATVMPHLDTLALAAEAQRRNERERYARLDLGDADTTDAESQRRRRARAIVERAIAVMGGRERFSSIVEMRAHVWIEAWEHVIEFPPPPHVINIGNYVYPIEEWHYNRSGQFASHSLQMQGSNLPQLAHNPAINRRLYTRLFSYRWLFLEQRAKEQRLEGEIARWHFIDRFFGDGTVLHYIDSEVFAGQDADAIRVDDRRYGHFLEDFFAQKSGLLLGVREGLTPGEAAAYKRKYQKRPPTWTTIYTKYKRVSGVLTPHRLTRSGPECPHCYGPAKRDVQLSIQLQIAYGEDEPDPTQHDLEYWSP